MKRLLLILLFAISAGILANVFTSTGHYQYNHKEIVYEVYYRLGKIDYNKLHVNDGGCGFLALYLSDYFDSTKVSYKINYIYKGLVSGIPNHVILKVGDETYLDVSGYSTKILFYIPYGNHFIEVSKEKLIYDLYHGEWNPKFNRSDTLILKNALK